MVFQEERINTLKNKQDVFLTCKDHTVSGEFFTLIKDKNVDMLFTFPKPEKQILSKYYESENYISHTDSKNSFTDKLYYIVKRIMLRSKINWIEKSLGKKGSLLDIGAGTGDFLFTAKNSGWEVQGVEPSSLARSKAQEKGISLLDNTTGLKGRKFDVITMWHVLEHVYNLDAQIEDLSKLLNNNGLLVIAVPNFRSDDANYYKEFWGAFDVPRHLYHFSQESIRSIFSRKNFILKETKPLFFDSFYVSLLSEVNKHGKKNLLRACYRGLLSNLKAIRTTEYSSIVYFLKKDSQNPV